eukprot:2548659-Rhodomonas_salina.1
MCTQRLSAAPTGVHNSAYSFHSLHTSPNLRGISSSRAYELTGERGRGGGPPSLSCQNAPA